MEGKARSLLQKGLHLDLLHGALNYKASHGCNYHCRSVSQCVSHCQPLLSQSSILGQGQELFTSGRLQSHPKTLDQGGSSWQQQMTINYKNKSFIELESQVQLDISSLYFPPPMQAANIRLGRKCLPITNALAYRSNVKIVFVRGSYYKNFLQ